jgi:peptidoglycan/LPS O-acetylase OafA/YrhL
MPSSSPPRLAGIELLRFAAALAVLIAHYNHFYIHGYTAENFTVAGQPLFRWLFPFYSYGTRAVEVFWCISGFIFCFNYGRIIHEKQMPAVRFFWLRFSRLYPLHLVTLLAVALLQALYRAKHGTYFVVEWNDLRHFALNLGFASNWGWQRGFSFNAPVWSVSLELLAYLFFYVATAWLGASFLTTLLWLAGCLLLDYFLGYEGVFVRCLFYFYLGGLSCLGYQFVRTRWRRQQFLVSLAAAALAAGCVWRFAVTQDLDHWLLDGAVPLLLLVFAVNSSRLENRLGAAANTLGNLTYASYLIHFPFQIAVMLVVGALAIDPHFVASPLFLGFYVGTVLLLSHFIYRRFEMPVQNLIRKRTIGGGRAAHLLPSP